MFSEDWSGNPDSAAANTNGADEGDSRRLRQQRFHSADANGCGDGDGVVGDGSAGPNEFARIVSFSHIPSNTLL